jgi:hypothetical protein
MSAVGAYVVLCVAQFLWKYVKEVGDDQDSKQAGIEDSIRQLAKLLHPELSAKAQHAINTLEQRIQEADAVFSKWPVTEEGLSAWTTQTERLLARTIGQGSDWFERFANDVREQPSRIEADRNFNHVLLLRRVAVLRDVIDEIKRQRVLVLAAR